MRVAVVVCIFLSSTGSMPVQTSEAVQSATDAAIERVKRVNAHALDARLPTAPFDVWLRRVVTPTTGIDWEVNDCGEQTGDPAVDRGRDFPICVEAQAVVPSVRGVDARVGIQIAVGTERSGIRGTPSVRWIYIEEGSTIGEVPALAGLEEAVAALRDGPSPYYRSGLREAVAACCVGLRLPAARDIRPPWSLGDSNFAIEGDFNGDGAIDVAVLLINARAAGGPALAVFQHTEGRFAVAYRQSLLKVDDVLISRPQEVVLRLVKRGEEWAPEGGDVPRAYAHAYDAIELSTHKATPTGDIEARQHLVHWNGRQYTMY